MTTENEFDAIKNDNNEIILNNEEKQEDNTNLPKIENEQINIETPKRPGRKKKENTSILNNDNTNDTQPLFEQPIIIEGKRSRKPTSRLELSDLETPKKELSIPIGHGKPLGEIEYINYQITNASNDVLSRMSSICFGRRASKTNIRDNLRDFNGFEFAKNSDEYQRHLSNLTKFKKDQLQTISDILGLSSNGSNTEQAENILNFLIEPIDEGKAIPERKMSMRTSTKSSTNSKQSVPTDEDDIENGDDELFGIDDEEEEEEKDDETDDDYIGSDEESALNTKDDPDDFVYQPGKKTPKKRSSIKRSRSRTISKRKRGSPGASKRGRKKTKVPVIENDEISTVPSETNNEKNDEIKNDDDDDLNKMDTEKSEENPSAPIADIN